MNNCAGKLFCAGFAPISILELCGCNTANSTNKISALSDGLEESGPTIQCAPPNIVTENGECQPPEVLSWKKK